LSSNDSGVYAKKIDFTGASDLSPSATPVIFKGGLFFLSGNRRIFQEGAWLKKEIPCCRKIILTGFYPANIHLKIAKIWRLIHQSSLRNTDAIR
jgi:hypothetical protein